MATQTTALSAIERLPLEVLLAISQHLPRPRPLIHLASASPTLYTQLAPVVHSSVTLSTRPQLGAFVEQAPRVVKQRTRRLTLDKSSPPWSSVDLERALNAVEELDALRLTDVALSPSHAVALLAQSRTAVASLDSLVLGFASASPDAHAQALLPWSNDAARGDTLPSAPPALAHARIPSLSHAPQPSQGPDSTAASAHVLLVLRACLAICPSLRSLRLANLPLPASALCGTFEGSASSSICVGDTRLRELELEEVYLVDEELREILRLTEGSLEVLKVVKCAGYSSAGLVEALKMHGSRLRKLEIVVAETKTTRRPTPPPPPPRSPHRSPAASPTLSAPQHRPTLTHALDAALPYLPHLTHISLSGSALVSSSALASLSTTTPHLRSLSLSQHVLNKPAHVLPLVRDGSTRLPHLRHIALHPPSPPPDSACIPSPSDEHDDPAVADLWTACLAWDIDLAGAPFERVKERLEWATKEAARVAVAGGKGGKGKRRKRPSLAV
ncbi:hypothetical protein JCM10296v2_000529 [Rhodotorula toruloides]